MQRIFIHGLESSGSGTKGRFFARHFPEVLRPDFSGDLATRMARLHALLAGGAPLVLVGSSYGGLMATLFAMDQPARLHRLVLLAPALNFPEFAAHGTGRVGVETWLYVGRSDTVTPAAAVEAAARQVFVNLHLRLVEDDHLLHAVFPRLDWPSLLG